MKSIALAALLAIAGLLFGGCGGEENGTTVRIRYSKFEPPIIQVNAGKPITIVLRNDDPIGHEWMVGGAAMHERHRTGTEEVHNFVPTEVTIPSLSSRTTTVVFDEPGDYKYICHLPGHEAYGMVGVLRVVDG